MAIVDPRGDELRQALMEALANGMPNVRWLDRGDALAYPDRSPVLGELLVGIEPDQLTVYVGSRGFHLHFLVFDRDGAGVRRTAEETAQFVRDLVADRIVVRWGATVSRVYRRGTVGPLGRLWRRLTPWAREAVWSGTVSPSGSEPN